MSQDFDAFGGSRLGDFRESPRGDRSRIVEMTPAFSTQVDPNGGTTGTIGYRLWDGTVGVPYFTLKGQPELGGDILDPMRLRSAFFPFDHPVDWFIHSGSLPPGLSLVDIDDDYAEIQGTPTTPGTYAFNVRARHDDLHTSERDCIIRVRPQINVVNLAAFNVVLAGLSVETDGQFLSVNTSDPDQFGDFRLYYNVVGDLEAYYGVVHPATFGSHYMILFIGAPNTISVGTGGFYGTYTKTDMDPSPAGDYEADGESEFILTLA